MWEAVGVTDRRAQIYETLVHQGRTDTGAVAAELGLTRAQSARALAELVDRGMVTRLPGRPARFAAVPPDQAADALIAEKEQGLSRLRSHAHQLAAAYHQAHTPWQHPAELVEIVEGSANIAAAFARLQQQAQYQVRAFDRPPYLANPVDRNPEEDHQRQERGIIYRVVYDHEALAVPGRMADIWNGIHNGEQARVGKVPIKVVLRDESAALIPVSTPDHKAPAVYLLHASALLDAVIALFEATWQRSVPLNRARPQEDASALSDQDIDLLGLLAGGSTDEAIARGIGWNVRTVRRHVSSLMGEVGAQTRFQLGLEAVRRKWV
ncbi:MAG: helix-turn-helix domain-containing protein [Nocardioidaceae bacterium]